ncbi:MAG: hypothetical protein HQL54_13040 [Magnetococcales bacterium]|nr:hypothetical protein [Magnetococcales bacterium]
MAVDLTKILLNGSIPIGELECFLSTNFGGSSQIEERIVLYGNCVQITYNKHNKVSKIEWINEDSADGKGKLIEKVKHDLLADYGYNIAQSYITSRTRIIGPCRIDDEFQIIPLPKGAPLPRMEWADHPAILQYKYKVSPNDLISSYRQEERFSYLINFLNIIIEGGLKYPSCSSRNVWVWPALDGNQLSEAEAEYRQVGFVTQKQWEEKDNQGFSISEEWEYVDYYSREKGIDIIYFASLANTIGPKYYSFKLLIPDDKEVFLRALHWYKCSEESFNISRSQSYANLVFSIEALLPKDCHKEKCHKCGKDIHKSSISERFKRVLIKYYFGENNNDEDEIKKNINKFLRMRSKYVHGSGLMVSDAEPIGFRFSATINADDHEYRKLYQICRAVLTNWLEHPERRMSHLNQTD